MRTELLSDKSITAIDNNVAVSAGAGSGKTFSLSNRFVYILEKYKNDASFKISNIVAATFTKKAALEMKERIRNFLRGEVEEQPEMERFLKDFDKANIVTIDSLQAKILRSHPVETGLDPNFVIVQGSDYDKLEDEIIRQFFRSQVDDEDFQALLKHFRFDELVSFIHKVMIYRNILNYSDEELTEGYGDSKELVQAFLRFVRQYYAFSQKELQAKNVLGYGDVTERCVQLLRDNVQIRRFYQQQYRFIMLDEFQDTNDIQRELFYLLCGDETGDKLVGNHLYVVGDVNQSIYKFRGADVRVFERVIQDIVNKAEESHVSKDDSLLSKTTNRRSTDKILDFVNKFFGDKLLLGDGLPKLKPVDSNISVGDKSFEKPIIKFFKPEKYVDKDGKEKAVDVAELILWEAEYVARRIERLHTKGEKYENIAVLLSKMTKLPLLAEALNRHNIPFVSMGGGKFYQQQEIYDILNVFRVLCSNDFIALLGVLRSPYFGFKDADIHKLIAKYDACRKCAKKEEKNAAICGAMLGDVGLSKLASLRRSAGSLGMAELWQDVFDKLFVEKTLLLQEQGHQCLANVEKLRTLCLEYCEKNKCGLADWLDYLDSTMKSSKEPSANIPAEGNVQIMTIHQSKGLGFDHVILPFLADRKGKGDSTSFEVTVERDTNKQQMGMRVPLSNDGAFYDVVKENNKDLELAEEIRKFYVAATRAKKTLYMSAGFAASNLSGRNMNKVDNYGGWLWRILQEEYTGEKRKVLWKNRYPDIVDIEEPVKGKFDKTEVLNCSVDIDKVKEKFEVLADKKYEIPSRITFTPTMLQTYLHCPRSYYYRYVCGLPEVDEGQGARSKEQGASEEQGNGLTPAEMGTLIHSALEHYDGDIETAWASALRAQGSGFRTQDSGVSFAKTLFVNYVNSDLFKQIPQQHDREVKFQLPIDDGVSFQGIMDCVYQKPDGTYGIVDYKTGVMPNQENLGYKMQLAIYAKAVEQMYRKAKADDDSKVRVSELNLHYLQAGKALPITSKEEYYGKAVEMAKEIQKLHTETDFDCKTEQCAHCGYQYLCRKAGKE